MFGWFPGCVSLIHINQYFALLQGKLWQGEHEDLIEDSHQAAGHCRGFLVPQLALVTLHTDPGIQGCATKRGQLGICYTTVCVLQYVCGFVFIFRFVIYLHLSVFQWGPFWPLAVQPQASEKWEEILKTEAPLLQDPVQKVGGQTLNIELFKDWMEEMFSKITHKTLFICGDFNIDLLNPDTK